MKLFKKFDPTFRLEITPFNWVIRLRKGSCSRVYWVAWLCFMVEYWNNE